MRDKSDISIAEWRRLGADLLNAELSVPAGLREIALDKALGSFVVTNVLLPGFDPVSAGALVWRGKLATFLLSDNVSRLSSSACKWLINGTVINAFHAWRRDYITRLGGAAGQSEGSDDCTALEDVYAAPAEASVPGVSAGCIDWLPIVRTVSEDVWVLNGEQLADRVVSAFEQLGMTISLDEAGTTSTP
ncbi:MULTISPECIES: hypothetical protein [Mycolicibacter]|uniref:Uncharacterized protein n=2 Tax=Mycolicibacter TaxID=1073531 RepID=A0ABU5XM54_9MYCO|nr:MULTISPECIES: hypothetical protein [unclassified Mycolicibacter]MEB3023363.1 hypothetical protein [Mycolicibacter sp. MYC098]MEB3033705.1 hypothetical protein [Mycolicibacter sp. MYC340]